MTRTRASAIEAVIREALEQAKPGCMDCGEPLGRKGGWGRCSRHYANARRNVIKEAAVRALGGACARCGLTSLPQACFDFHHPGEKNADPASLIGSTAPTVLARELALCELLCANCHRMEHINEL